MMQNKPKEQMTEEELQRTQVLNFDSFKQIARFERISSKKPALIIALFGIFAIISGLSYPMVNTFIKNRTEKPKYTVQARKEIETTKKELECNKPLQVNPDGTEETIKVNYSFEDDKLVSATKVYNIKASAGAANGPAAITKFKTDLQPHLVNQTGYSVSVKESDAGVEVTTQIDYKTANINSLPESNQSNYRFNITYIKDAPSKSIIEDMTNQKYTCS